MASGDGASARDATSDSVALGDAGDAGALAVDASDAAIDVYDAGSGATVSCAGYNYPESVSVNVSCTGTFST